MAAASTGATLYRLAVGSGTLHRQQDAVAIAGRAGRHIRRHISIYAVGAALFLLSLTPALYAIPILGAVTVVGGRAGWERRQAERSATPPTARYLTARRLWAGTGLLLLAGSYLTWAGQGAWVGLAGLAAIVWLVRTRIPKTVPWWAEKRLSAALVESGVASWVGAGDRRRLPTVSRHGQPRTDDRGTTVKVNLPGAATAADLIAKRDKFASYLDLPSRLVQIDHDPDDSPGLVTIWVGTAPSKDQRPSDLAQVDATVWEQQFRIGEDTQGTPVNLLTVGAHGVHTAIVGATGKGKTGLVRQLAGHALLDPTVKIYAVSGKGSSSDWDAMGPLCETFIDRVTDESPQQVEQLLTDVIAVAREQDAQSRGRRGRPPGVLLLLEEWGNIRSHVGAVGGPKALARVDALFTSVAATARSGGVHAVVITQKPTADSLPTLQRGNLTQRVAFQCLSDVDLRIGLMDRKPTGPVPRRVGEALLVNEDVEQQFFKVDWFTDADWEDLCSRAARLRAHPVTAADTLDDAVVKLLTAEPMGATQMFYALPEGLRPANVVHLGRWLAAHSKAGAPWTQRTNSKGREWQITRLEAPVTRRPAAPATLVTGGTDSKPTLNEASVREGVLS